MGWVTCNSQVGWVCVSRLTPSLQGTAFIGPGSPAWWQRVSGEWRPVKSARSDMGDEREEGGESRGHCQRSQPDKHNHYIRQRWSSILKFLLWVYTFIVYQLLSRCHQSTVLEELSQDVSRSRFCPKSRWWFDGHVKGQNKSWTIVQSRHQITISGSPRPDPASKTQNFQNFNPRPTYSSVNCLWQHLQR